MSVIEQAAKLLVEAHLNMATVTAKFPSLTVEQAYLVQEKVMDNLGIKLEDITCWKVGMGTLLDEPIFAPIYPDLIHLNGDTIACRNYRDLHVELEWGFRLIKPITLDDCSSHMNAIIDYFSIPFACFELVDSRLSPEFFNNSEAKLADNQITSGVVIGESIPANLLNTSSKMTHQLICDGQIVIDGKGGHPLNDPKVALLKGLKKLLKHVNYLPEGTMLLTGSWNGLVPISNYFRISANFEKQAQVSFQFLRN